MTDHFKYFLKPEERRSNKIKKTTTRKWNVILTLSNVALLMLIFFLVYKPAMERLNKENKVYINNFAVEIDYEITENNIFVNLYIFNEDIPNYFDFSKLSCSLIFVDGEEVYPLNTRKDTQLINKNNGLHYILSFPLKEKRNIGFFIRLKYDNKTIYESKTIKRTN